MAQVCSKCGAPLRPGAKFCTKCGERVVVAAPQQAAPQQVSPQPANNASQEVKPVQAQPAPQQPKPAPAPKPVVIDEKYIEGRKRTVKRFFTLAMIFGIVNSLVAIFYIVISAIFLDAQYYEFGEINPNYIVSIALAGVGLLLFGLFLLLRKKAVVAMVCSLGSGVFIIASSFFHVKPYNGFVFFSFLLLFASIPMNILFVTFSKSLKNAQIEFEKNKKLKAEKEKKEKEKKEEEEKEPKESKEEAK